MPRIRNVVVVVLSLVLFGGVGWSRLPREPSDLTLMTGCSWVQTEHLVVDGAAVVDVRAAGCGSEHRQNLSAAKVGIAGATWESLHRPVDTINVRLLDDTEEAAETVAYSSVTLAAQYEMGSAPPPTPSVASILWLLVPVAYLVAFAVMCVMVTRLRRVGAVLLVVRN